jgi:hypothetical protein
MSAFSNRDDHVRLDICGHSWIGDLEAIPPMAEESQSGIGARKSCESSPLRGGGAFNPPCKTDFKSFLLSSEKEPPESRDRLDRFRCHFAIESDELT